MSILLYKTVSLLILLISVVTAQDFIRVDTPKVSETIASKRFINITYTVLGYKTVTPIFPKFYPSSLSLDFGWKEQANGTSTYSIQLATGLFTVPYIDGSRNIEIKEIWRVPNCRFFSRYPPTLYDFSLTFTPVYITTVNVTGVPQKPIVVPLSIVVDNSTFPRC